MGRSARVAASVSVKLALVAAVFVAGFAMFQDHLLYFPTRASVDDVAGPQLSPWPAREDFRGLIGAPQGPARGTAIVFHGNAGHAGHRAFYARALTPLGLRVVLAEYPGYGPRDGELGEASLVSDAALTVERVHREFGPPLVLIGESLGAAVAAGAAARLREQVAALWLITPWDRLGNVGSHHYPWLPVEWLLRDRYDSVAALKGFAGPVRITVAADDTIVPARFGLALHDALAVPKSLDVLESTGHNDWPARVGAAWWQQAVDALLPRR